VENAAFPQSFSAEPGKEFKSPPIPIDNSFDYNRLAGRADSSSRIAISAFPDVL
jgi:hypothetical protein